MWLRWVVQELLDNSQRKRFSATGEALYTLCTHPSGLQVGTLCPDILGKVYLRCNLSRGHCVRTRRIGNIQQVQEDHVVAELCCRHAYTWW